MGVDAIVITGAAASPRCCSSTRTVRARAGRRPVGPPGGRAEAAARGPLARVAIAAIGPAGEHLVRYAGLARRASRRPRRARRGARGETHQGHRRARQRRVPDRRPRRASHATICATLARPGHREIPRARHRRQPATFNRLAACRRATSSRARSRARRSSGEELARRAARGAARARRAPSAASTSSATRAADSAREYENVFALGPLCGIGIPRRARRPRAPATSSASTPSPPAGPSRSPWSAPSAACSRAVAALRRRPAPPRALDESPRARGSATCSPRARAARAPRSAAPGLRPHVKGLELPGYEPRALQAMALGFAVGARGADHNRSGAYEAIRRRTTAWPTGGARRRRDRDRGPRGDHRLADPVQVPARRSPTSSGKSAPMLAAVTGSTRRRRAAAHRRADRARQAPVQRARGVDGGRTRSPSVSSPRPSSSSRGGSAALTPQALRGHDRRVLRQQRTRRRRLAGRRQARGARLGPPPRALTAVGAPREFFAVRTVAEALAGFRPARRTASRGRRARRRAWARPRRAGARAARPAGLCFSTSSTFDSGRRISMRTSSALSICPAFPMLGFEPEATISAHAFAHERATLIEPDDSRTGGGEHVDQLFLLSFGRKNN